MILKYQVIQPSREPSLNKGTLLGYAFYHTVSDIFGDAIHSTNWDDPNGLVGEWTCRSAEHPRQEVTLLRSGEEFQFRYCPDCVCLVTPPHDGYVYHEYDCEMDASCKCEAIP